MDVKNFIYGWFIFSILAVLSIVFFQGFVEYKKAVDDIKTLTYNTSTLLAERIENDFKQSDTLLKLAEYVILSLNPKDKEFLKSSKEKQKKITQEKFKFLVDRFPDINIVNYTDTNGDILYSSNILNPSLNISNQEHFKQLKNDKNLNETFSELIFSDTSNTYYITHSKAIRDENKELIGVLSTLIDIKTLYNILASINTGKNGIIFIKNSKTSNTIVSHSSNNKNILYENTTSSKIIAEKIASGEKFGSFAYKIEEGERITSFLLMDKYPFYIQATLAEQNYLENWARNLFLVIGLTMIFVLTSLSFLVMLRIKYNKEKSLIKETKIIKNRFENMFKIHSSIMLLIDPKNGDILDANQSAVKFYGYSIEELKNMKISQINELPFDEARKKYEEATNLKQNTFTFYHRLKNGDSKIVEVHSSPIKTESGTILFSIIKDITNERITQNTLEEYYKNLQKLIEVQSNIIILTDGKEMLFGNKKFFNFLGFDNLSDFKKMHKCICEFFVEDDRFFHLKKIKEEENWIDKINLLEESKRIVSMIGKDYKRYIFSVSVNNFDDYNVIVSFTDITQTIVEKSYLEKRILHDKLTNAYNREFFDKNYESLINEYNTNETKLAIAMLDIDHFKKVNDEFGHDIGDEVLIQFVNTLHEHSRKNDILIRWGGEEFIMILKIDEPKYLDKILENLRLAIEDQTFAKVGKKTCSIGGTIYKDNEDIFKTIKRADEAMYQAKNLGRNKVVIL